LLESGDKVPADLRLINQLDMHVDESLLSGESLPVVKDANAVLAKDTLTADRVNMAYSGTMVVRGRATGVVIATAMDTVLGKIARDVLRREHRKPPLLQRMERFTFRMAIAMSLVISLVAIISALQGMGWAEVFLLAVALAVAAIPEGLPVAMTVALAISMRRMAKRNVIARRLVTVEALGSCTFIASDKTGTLTQNRISVKKVVLPGKQPFSLTISTLNELNAESPDFHNIPVESVSQFNQLLKAMILPNEAFLGHRNGTWVSHGDSVDIALLMMGHQYGYHRADTLARSPLLGMIPFESGNRYSASLHKLDQQQQIYIKGAVESLVGMCSTMLVNGEPVPIQQEAILQQAHELAEEGYRVLAAASGKPENELQQLDVTSLHDLSFIGLVGMIDPLRPESKDAITSCYKAGIDVAMVTGDHPLTAYAIGKELEFVSNKSQVVTSQEFNATHDDPIKRAELLKSARVFARMEPHQKLDIVEALQQQGHFVAVTGDGANDAPALRAAHVGVAMGKAGTDVARETADMIVTDDNFSSIVAGIEEGRIAYSNVRKVIHLLISTGAGEIVLFALSLLMGLPIPLTAVQLLWLNLVTNGIQDVALAFEPGEGDELNRPPRDPREPIFNRVMIERVILAALVMGIVACFTFYSLLQQGFTEEQARNGTLLLMVLFENVHAFNSRSETRSVFLHNPLRNPLLFFGTIAAQGIHILAMYTPGLKDVLELSPVTLTQWFSLLGLALVLLMASELYKAAWVFRRQTAR
jgi:Ca2+-transporting ATPase